MLIAGLQKMSLVDFPGRIACTVFTGGCNLRCPYCHNSELLSRVPAAMTEDELFSFLSRRTGLLDGVCITGGEPCLQKDLPAFLTRLRQMPFAIKLDTNGTFPEMLKTVLERKLADYIAVDIKNAPDRLDETTGLCGKMSPLGKSSGAGVSEGSGGVPSDSDTSLRFPLEAFRESVSLLLASGTDFELRTTVVTQLHDEAAFAGIRDLLLPLTEKAGRKIPAFYLQAFHDRDTVVFDGFTAPDKTELEAFARILAPIAETVSLRGV